MLTRICLIVAILAGLAVGAFNFVKVKEQVTLLRQDRDNELDAKKKALGDLDKTQKTLTKTEADLTKTKADLTSAQSARDKALADAAAQNKRATDLADQLAKTIQARDDAQRELARYTATGVKPEEILAFTKQVKLMQDSLAEAGVVIKGLQRENGSLQARLKIYENPNEFVTAPASLKGKIAVADPKWEFVVLDIGEDQNVPLNCEFLVSRNGLLVAKVKVTRVQKDSSTANVLPGWKIGEVFEGDQVIPAHPKT